MKDKSTADAINDVLEAKMVFPQVAEVGETFIANGGLSLRDLFAIVTMHAMFGSQVDSFIQRDDPKGLHHALAGTASIAYLAADAMLAAREKER